MRIGIQIAVVIVALLLVFFALNSRTTSAGRAWKKIGLVFLAVMMIIAVLFPELTNHLANFVGVGRGADLLLYMLSLAFVLYVLNTYMHRIDEKDTTYRLARKIAIIEANERYGIRAKTN